MPLAPFISVVKRNADGSPVIGQDGRPVVGIGINEIKNHVRGYWLVSDPVTLQLAPGARDELRFLVDTQGHFDWAYIIGDSDGPYTMEFFDGGTQRRLQNKPVHSETIVGSAVRPFRMPEPYFMNVGDGQREISVTVRNVLYGSTNRIRLVLYGRRFYHKEAPPIIAREIAEKFTDGWRTNSYFLVPKETKGDGTIDPIPANGTVTYTFDMDKSADTDLQKLMFKSGGDFLFQLRERATNRALMNGNVLSRMGWGNAEFPFMLADTLLIERNKQLLMEITDVSGRDNTVYCTIAGRRLQYF